MSRKSVFKFKINNYTGKSTHDKIRRIIARFLEYGDFYYDKESNSYRAIRHNAFTKKDDGSIEKLLTTPPTNIRDMLRCPITKVFEFQLNEKQLIIKVYMEDSGVKYSIPVRGFYAIGPSRAIIFAALDYDFELKDLFKKLEEENIIYESKEIEKIKESYKKYLEFYLSVFGTISLALVLFITIMELIELIIKIYYKVY